MPHRTFQGHVPAVDVMLADPKHVEFGETVEVSDVEAASLDAQGGWVNPDAVDDAAPAEIFDDSAAPSGVIVKTAVVADGPSFPGPGSTVGDRPTNPTASEE